MKTKELEADLARLRESMASASRQHLNSIDAWAAACDAEVAKRKEVEERIDELKLNSVRLHWLHDCSNGVTDLEGYEWGIYRVKWQGGKAVDVLATRSDFSDLDSAMKAELTGLPSPVDLSKKHATIFDKSGNKTFDEEWSALLATADGAGHTPGDYNSGPIYRPAKNNLERLDNFLAQNEPAPRQSQEAKLANEEREGVDFPLGINADQNKSEITLGQAKTIIGHTQAALDALRTRLTASEARGKELEGERDELKKKLFLEENNRNQLASLGHEIDTLRTRLAASETKTKELEEELRKAELNLDSWVNSAIRNMGGKTFPKAHLIDSVAKTIKHHYERSARLTAAESARRGLPSWNPTMHGCGRR